MKFFVLMFLIFNILQAKQVVDDGLPNEPDTTELKLNKISKEDSIVVNFNLKLPGNQGLSKGAPSFVGIFEKFKNQDWTETERVDLNQFFTLSDELAFSKKINLRSAESEVAVYSTIYHCGKDHKTGCYIQGFKGKAIRSGKANSKSITFSVEPKI